MRQSPYRRLSRTLVLWVAILGCAQSVRGEVHGRYLAAASSTLPGWSDSNLIDGNRDSAWSSSLCPTANCYVWVAFWLAGGNQTVDYVRLVPRLYNGKPQAVPRSINVYYVGPDTGGNWSSAPIVSTSLDVESDFPRSGGLVYFPHSVVANGILITTADLGVDDFGGHYFQMAEMYAGNSAVPSKTIDYGTFACESFADSPRRALTNDNENLAYDFNATQIAPGSYVSVFHSEAFGQAAPSPGDSTAVRYASSPDGPFGVRTGADAGDHVVTRTETPSTYMYAGSTGPLGQGANPILIQREADPKWTLFYLGVTDLGSSPGWRHYLMVGHPWDVTNMTNTSWVSLSNDGAGDYWNWFCGSPFLSCGSIAKNQFGNRRSYNPSPARALSGPHAHVTSDFGVPNPGDTQGLIGNISYAPEDSAMHFFYIDFQGQPGQGFATFRRDSCAQDCVNYWSEGVKVMDNWATKIAFHPARNRWAVFSICGNNDLCLQYSANNLMSSLTSMNASSSTAFSLGLADWFRDAAHGGVMEQFGILKNPKGQVNADDFRVYVGERGVGGAGGLYGMDISAIRVRCYSK